MQHVKYIQLDRNYPISKGYLMRLFLQQVLMQQSSIMHQQNRTSDN